VISATDEMVLAPDRETGVGGVSDIRFIDIVHPTGVVVRHLIAKFDRADRADREWETMEHLRLLSLSRDIVLPEKYSHGDDGVIVSPAARTTNSGPARQFASYVRENLLPAPQNCVASIELAFGLLGQFYRIHPGDHTDRVGSSRSTWGAAMPRGWAAPGANVLYLGDVEVLYDACRHHWSKPAVDAWKTARSFSKDNGWEVPRPIPNPIGRLPRLLDRQTGPVRLSRIHGDLNLTNLMVAAHPDGTPEKVFVIDLANSERDRPTAFDFARLEVAFWVEMFGTLVRPDQQEADWMPHLIALRDRLDGRPPVSAPGPLGGLREFGKLVNAVRHQAFLALRPPGTPDIGGHYILTDYFHGLYFTFLSMFRHDSIRANGFQCRMLLLGASLSLRVLDDTVGYGSNAESPFPRPWESAEFE
jgi:hypothetical protein